MPFFRDLTLSLPSPPYETIEDEARATLRLLFETPLDFRLGTTENENVCPNCGGHAVSTKSPYCGEECREIAGFVRQTRSGLRDGSIMDRDRQIALGQIFWRLLGGGLPLRNSLIKPKELERLFAKYDGQCIECGAPATTVDHIESRHCNRPINLRPKCEACAHTKPFGTPEVLSKSSALLDELAVRIGSDQALRVCDDAETWDWRTFIAERKELIAGRKG